VELSIKITQVLNQSQYFRILFMGFNKTLTHTHCEELIVQSAKKP